MRQPSVPILGWTLRSADTLRSANCSHGSMSCEKKRLTEVLRQDKVCVSNQRPMGFALDKRSR